MRDPSGKGIFFVNGKSSTLLTVYHVRSKSTDELLSENSTQPTISPDAKLVMYIRVPDQNRNELWVAEINGGNPRKIAASGNLTTGNFSPDGSHLIYSDGSAAANSAIVVGSDGRDPHEVKGIEWANLHLHSRMSLIALNGMTGSGPRMPALKSASLRTQNSERKRVMEASTATLRKTPLDVFGQPRTRPFAIERCTVPFVQPVL